MKKGIIGKIIAIIIALLVVVIGSVTVRSTAGDNWYYSTFMALLPPLFHWGG